MIYLPPSLETWVVDAPFFSSIFQDQEPHIIPFVKIRFVNHRRHGQIQSISPSNLHSLYCSPERSLSPYGLMSPLHSVQTYLNLMKIQFRCQLIIQEHSVGQEYRSDGIVADNIV